MLLSKKLDKHQHNYSTIEKECLALILALAHFEVYISSSAVHPIIVFSDHNPLTFIDKVRCKNQRLLHWSLMLQEFNIEIRHIRAIMCVFLAVLVICAIVYVVVIIIGVNVVIFVIIICGCLCLVILVIIILQLMFSNHHMEWN